MKPLTDTLTTRSTMGASQTATMSIDTDAVAHLMSVLTNLYSNPIAAVIREYATNGFDATVDAGAADPIRVTLPTVTHPTLTIQDFGIGMSTDRILDHYSLYGRSDKRGSNDVVGMLGLGCKSALTYSSSFSVTSIHNGVETVALIAKNSDGVGEIQIVDTRTTDKRNGTTVEIPVKGNDIYRFAREAEAIFGYWTPGTVLVDSKAPVSAYADFHKIPNVDSYYKPNGGYNDHRVVMGNVSYKVNSDILGDFSSTPLIINAPIGAVSFAPSREELMYNNRTNEFLRKIVTDIKSGIQTEIDNILATATNKWEAFQARGKNAHFKFLSNVKWEFQGEVIPANIQSSSTLVWSRDKYPEGKAKADSRWSTNGAEKVVFISGYPYQSVSQRIKDAMVAWSDDDKHPWFGVKRFILADSPVSDWVEWADWKPLSKTLPKIDKAASGVRFTNKRSGRLIDKNGWCRESYQAASDFPDDDFFVITPEDLREQNFGRVALAQIFEAGYKPVLVYKRDVAAFTEAYNIVTDEDVIKWRESLDAKRSDDWYLARVVEHSQIHNFKGKKILDPEIARLLQLTMDAKISNSYLDNTRLLKAEQIVKNATSGYPLLDVYYYRTDNSDAKVEYVNALYTYRLGKKAN